MPDTATLPVYVVDAFTAVPFAGNPAAVVSVHDWPAPDLMQAIAAEMNLSETAFCRARPDGSWDLRWFTPIHEADFCGHATLATAHVLVSQCGAAGRLRFHTRMGLLSVLAEQDALHLDIPALSPNPLTGLPDGLQDMFTTLPEAVFRNFENLFCVLQDAGSVREFVPDFARMAVLGKIGLCITAPGAEGIDFVSRYFAPGGGIPEDPVTGSTHATLVPYWADRLGRASLVARQLSERGGCLNCRLEGDRVRLSGQAVTVMRGMLTVPDKTGSHRL